MIMKLTTTLYETLQIVGHYHIGVNRRDGSSAGFIDDGTHRVYNVTLAASTCAEIFLNLRSNTCDDDRPLVTSHCHLTIANHGNTLPNCPWM